MAVICSTYDSINNNNFFNNRINAQIFLKKVENSLSRTLEDFQREFLQSK